MTNDLIKAINIMLENNMENEAKVVIEHSPEEVKNMFTHCAECGKVIYKNEEHVYQENYYCDEHFDEKFSICEECGCVTPKDKICSILFHDDTIYICEECRDDYFFICQRCEEWERYGDSTIVYTSDGEERWCDGCASEFAAYCESCEEYYDGDLDCCPNCGHYNDDDEESIHSYGFKPSPRFNNCGNGDGDDRLYMGVELEVDDIEEITSPGRSAKEVANVANGLIYCKHDGSIDNGYENVTHPATLKFHQNIAGWNDILDTIRSSGYGAADCCGLHVHVSRDFFGDDEDAQDLQISKLILLMNRFWNSHIVPLTRRDPDRLARWASRGTALDNACTKETRMSLIEKCKHVRGNRYQAINLNNMNTIEFRIFASTTNVDHLLGTLEFVDSICRSAKRMKLKEVQNCTWNDILPANPTIHLTNLLNDVMGEFDSTKEVKPLKPAVKLESDSDDVVANFGVGDIVQVLSWSTMCSRFPHDSNTIYTDYAMFLEDMKEYCGKKMRVTEVIDNRYYHLCDASIEDVAAVHATDNEVDWAFTDSMLREKRSSTPSVEIDPEEITLEE